MATVDSVDELVRAVTFGLALLGAVLGVMNTWRTFDRDRPKLRVVFKHAIPVGMASSRIRYSIEVINLSTFPLTIGEIGFQLRGTDTRAAISQPTLIDSKPWPRRLEPRESVTAYIVGDDLDATPRPLRRAYATTTCGFTATGMTPAMKQVAAAHRARVADSRER